MRNFLVLISLVLAFGGHLLADEPTRCAQEELRKRNLYFGDVDGRMNEEFRGALKRYQARKSLNVTGEMDEDTANSLKVPIAISQSRPAEKWPDLPVLKSDAARELPEPERLALQQKAEVETEAANAAPIPAESPTDLPSLSAEQATKFITDYLRDAESDDVDLQVSYYGFPIEYFDHGQVDRAYVARDTRNYCQRWPKRHYVLVGPVSVSASNNTNEAQVQFAIDFTVKNSKHTVNGRTKNYWTVKVENDQKLKINTIREQRSHDS